MRKLPQIAGNLPLQRQFRGKLGIYMDGGDVVFWGCDCDDLK